MVNSIVYADTADPSFADESGYYPIEKEMESLVYSTLPLVEHGVTPVVEIMLK